MKDAHSTRHIVQIAVLQSFFIGAIAIVLALGSNALRTHQLPLVGDWRVESQFSTESGESLVISIEAARTLYDADGAVFMDARNSDQYMEGHIQGAINLPWHEVEERFMEVMPTISPDAHIITYCDGESCRLSHDLALFLREMGFEVNVLINGWSLWKESGLPIEE